MALESPLSPLDGRYAPLVAELAESFSEATLNRTRLEVEIEWLIALTDHGVAGSSALSEEKKSALRARVANFFRADVEKLASIEATTQHDVKAIEYFLRQILEDEGLKEISELAHFAATSEDINNLSYALMVKRSVNNVWMPEALAVYATLVELAKKWRDIPMLARTHGQPATPTTFGKELAVFAHRLRAALDEVALCRYPGKFNGASGTYSAHVSAWPSADWPAVSKAFVESLGLEWNPLTTQIESHDGQVRMFQRLNHAGRILHNLCTDAWTYISLGYLRQIPQEGATGSSTMPHKVNPIRFENAEANLEIAGGLFDTLSATLVTSRLQRDLTDSTTQRNIGVAMGHQMVALKNIQRGLSEVEVDADAMARDLEANVEVLAEAIQTVIRAEIVAGNSTITDPYDVVKNLTRGKRVTPESLMEFVDTLDISDSAKASLRELRPDTYTGLASSLVDYLDD
jgi:adenylosuccinate lyase